MQMTEQSLIDVENTIHGFKNSVPIFFSKMVPKHLFPVKNAMSHLSLEALRDATVLCVSGIGSADAFFKCIGMVSCFVLFIILMLTGFCETPNSFFFFLI